MMDSVNTQAVAQTPVVANPAQNTGLVYANFGRRFLASLVDSLIIIVPVAIITIPITLLGALGSGINNSPSSATPQALGLIFGSQVLATIIGAVIGLAYNVLLIGSKGQTVGMMAIGIKVRPNEEGVILDKQRALKRAILPVGLQILMGLPLINALAGLVYLLDGLSMLWDVNKQTFHDKIGKTVVVRT